MMGWPIITYQTSSVKAKSNRQLLQAYIMNPLVVTTLGKGRIKSHHRMCSCSSHTASHCYSMLLSDAYIKKPLWEFQGKWL